MGFFGKKKDAKSRSSQSQSQSQSSTTGQYVAPAPFDSTTNTSSTAAPTPATPQISNRLELGDLEEATNASPSPAPISSTAEVQVETVMGDTATYDDGTTRTYRTDYSYPTLKTADSEDSKDTSYSITRNGQYLTLNGFANGHLMRWKFAAEEGPPLIRIQAVLLALGTILTSTYPIVADPSYWTVPNVICCFHVCVMAFVIIMLEGRVFCGARSPTNVRARMRASITHYISLFRLLWGRGMLYMFCGSLNLTITHTYVIYTGLPLLLLGVVAICAGAHASYNLDKMKTSLTDEDYLWSRFDACDTDKDNVIGVDSFAELLWNLGLEFDDAYTSKAFSQVDLDGDGVISFEEFRSWWIVRHAGGRTTGNTNNNQ